MTKKELWNLDDYRGQNVLDVCDMLLAACHERIRFWNPDFYFDSFVNSTRPYPYNRKTLSYDADGFLCFNRPLSKEKKESYENSLNTIPYWVIIDFLKNVISGFISFHDKNKILNFNVKVEELLSMDSNDAYEYDQEYEGHTDYSQYIADFQNEFPEWFRDAIINRSVSKESLFARQFRMHHIWQNDFFLNAKKLLKKCTHINIANGVLEKLGKETLGYARTYVKDAQVISDSEITSLLEKIWNHTQKTFKNKKGFTADGLSSSYKSSSVDSIADIDEVKRMSVQKRIFNDSSFRYSGWASYEQSVDYLNYSVSLEDLQKRGILSFLEKFNSDQIARMSFTPFFNLPYRRNPGPQFIETSFGVVDMTKYPPRGEFYYPASLPDENPDGSVKKLLDDGGGYLWKFPSPVFTAETMPDYKIRTEEMSSATDIIAEAGENRYFYFSPGYILFTYSFDFK